MNTSIVTTHSMFESRSLEGGGDSNEPVCDPAGSGFAGFGPRLRAARLNRGIARYDLFGMGTSPNRRY